MLVTIDEYAGFCPGVIRAIRNAEKILDEKGELFCLGELVHNREEMKRLSSRGLKVIDYYEFGELQQKHIMFRAHGEPPGSYKQSVNNNQVLHDNTCSIVKKLQEKIREEYEKKGRKNIVIFGKKDHPEVIGLAGHTENTAIIVQDKSDIDTIDFSLPVILYSQTTMNAEGLKELSELLNAKAKEHGVDFEVNNSICSQVSRRMEKAGSFAKRFDVVLFVSGKNSSNGKYLYGIMQDANANTHWISNPAEILPEWFKNAESVGISGATSTPPWLLEKIADQVNRF